MKNEKNDMIIVILTILIFSQAFVIYFVYQKYNEVSSTNTNLGSSIQDLESKIKELASKTEKLSSSESDIGKQISLVYANSTNDFSGIIENSLKGVVTIKTDVAQGAGFFVTDDGYIITNAHVLRYARKVEVITSDGEVHDVEPIGYDPLADVAILKANGTFHNLDLGNSDSVKIGERIIAIGDPLGLSFSASEGIISARDRKGSNNLSDYFQTDVSLNPGNSGGPLINSAGEVVGINNFKIKGAENVGFALEINKAIEVANKISEGKVGRVIIPQQ